MRSTRVDWLIFLALGFMWGSSYLFIKVGVQDFGTFTLVALRLAVGAALLWTVLRVARTRLPRTPRVYGHLLVMALVNITIPFLLITWAEKSVESALVGIAIDRHALARRASSPRSPRCSRRSCPSSSSSSHRCSSTTSRCG